MIDPLTRPALPAKFALPLRDLLRGIRRSVSGAADAFGSVEPMLPRPLRHLAHGVVNQIQPDRDRAWPTHYADRLQQLLGTTPLSQAMSGTRFARIAYHALNFALLRQGCRSLMVSETVAGLAYRRALAATPADGSQFLRVAHILAEFRSLHVIGVAPGTEIALDRQHDERIRTAIFAFGLWFLADRPATPAGEPEMLALCVDLTLPLRDQGVTDEADVAPLAGLLEKYSAAI